MNNDFCLSAAGDGGLLASQQEDSGNEIHQNLKLKKILPHNINLHTHNSSQTSNHDQSTAAVREPDRIYFKKLFWEEIGK
jgi:hypothetical protein